MQISVNTALEILQSFSEAATGGGPQKKVFLKLSRYSQVKSCEKVSFLIKLQALIKRPQ